MRLISLENVSTRAYEVNKDSELARMCGEVKAAPLVAAASKVDIKLLHAKVFQPLIQLDYCLHSSLLSLAHGCM